MWGEAQPGTERWIPLHTAFCCGNDSVALYLISKGSSIWLNEYHTITAMHQAAEMGHLTILEALLAKDPKLDVNLKEGSQKTPMMYAHGGKQSTETILWLLEHGADPNASIDENGISLLQVSARHSRIPAWSEFTHNRARRLSARPTGKRKPTADKLFSCRLPASLAAFSSPRPSYAPALTATRNGGGHLRKP